MEHLTESGESSVDEYSDSFELDDTDSKELSIEFNHEEHDDVELESALNEILDHPPSNKKPPTSATKLHSSGRDHVDLGRTVKSPIAMAEHLHQHHSTNEKTLSPPLNSTTRSLTLNFKEVAGKVQKLQSSAKKFKNSGEIREVVFKEWLAKKEVKAMRAKKSFERSRKIDVEKKRNKEV